MPLRDLFTRRDESEPAGQGGGPVLRRRMQEALKPWVDADFAMPAPQQVKWSVLRRYGRGTDTWVETGTFHGRTTAYLAKEAAHVYTIEPEPTLAARARERFAETPNVTVLEGLSEDRFPELLPRLTGPVSFWLDGHWSGGVTFQGPAHTPIREELAAIEATLGRLGDVTVFVDDLRCFDPTEPEFAAYPSRGWLVDWADRNGLTWTIEHDIFAAWRR